jgi:chromatin remodeling complex protein RSC6
MAKKPTSRSSKAKSEEKTVAVPAPTPVPTPAPAVAAQPAKRSRKAPAKPVVQVTEDEETVVSDVEESTVTGAGTETTGTRKKRYVPTRDSVLEEFDSLVLSVEEEIARLRDASNKSKGVKFLRSVNKRVKTLRAHVSRVVKQRKNTGRKPNVNSGFLKPVRISSEMAAFTGWEPDVPRSRVDVTKYICDYIKRKDLQNPEDRREILVDKDQKLKNLLKFDSKEGNHLTYYKLQTSMKPHFLPVEASE